MIYIQNTPEELNSLIDWLYGREAENSALGNIARFMQANVKRRPAVGSQPRWANFDALRSINAGYKYFDPIDLETAIEAFRTDAVVEAFRANVDG